MLYSESVITGLWFQASTDLRMASQLHTKSQWHLKIALSSPFLQVVSGEWTTWQPFLCCSCALDSSSAATISFSQGFKSITKRFSVHFYFDQLELHYNSLKRAVLRNSSAITLQGQHKAHKHADIGAFAMSSLYYSFGEMNLGKSKVNFMILHTNLAIFRFYEFHWNHEPSSLYRPPI